MAVRRAPIRQRELRSEPAVRPARDVPARDPAPTAARTLLNRDLSWIDFDCRVLELAADPTLRLLDRVWLCGIASSNLEEFFAVRMAELHAQAVAGISRREPDGRTPAQTLADARQAILELGAAHDALWLTDLRPALAAAGIRICEPEDCRPHELRSLTRLCEREVLPLLTPIAVGPGAPFPHVRLLGLNLAAVVETGAESRFVCVGIPDDIPRFLEVGTRGVRVPVESALRPLLPSLVGRGTVKHAAVFRVTRDADVSVREDVDDLLTALESELRQRSHGRVVRLMVNADAAAEIRESLMRELGLEQDQVFESAAPLGLAALTDLEV